MSDKAYAPKETESKEERGDANFYEILVGDRLAKKLNLNNSFA